MNGLNLVGFIFVLLCALLMAVFGFARRKRPRVNLRNIIAFSRLQRAIGLAVEDGSRLHVALGSGNMLTPQNASGLVGLTMLQQIALLSSISDRPPIATSGDPTLAILSQDTLHSAYRTANALDLYDPTRARFSGPTPFSYAAGALPVAWDESVSASILVGNFGAELALLLDGAEQENSFTLAASDSLQAQSILYAAAQEPLIGEELFAGGAYLQAGSMHTASLQAQDVLRWVIVGALLAGSVLKLIGVL